MRDHPIAGRPSGGTNKIADPRIAVSRKEANDEALAMVAWA
jgi:hypothetical protein